MEYYFANDDQQKGPFARDALRGAGMKPDSLVWREGMSAWERADSVAELSDLFPAAPAAGAKGTSPDPWPQAPAVAAPASAPGPYPPAPQYTPAPAPYGTPSYGTAAAGGYAGAGQQLPYGGYAPPGAMLPTGMAVASMVLGIASIPMTWFYCFGTPCAILAIIFGHVARARIRRGEAAGSGMAMAGLVCGYIMLAVAVVLIVVIVFVIGVSAFQHR